jgi:hypothetical protein
MPAWLRAGLAYGAIIFALGFVLGAAREMVLAPLFGRDVVVLVEGPVILLASWFAAILLVLRNVVPASVQARLAMGATAFALVMVGEALVAVFGLGRSLSMHLSAYATQRGMLELMPQVAFALFPVVHLLREARP